MFKIEESAGAQDDYIAMAEVSMAVAPHYPVSAGDLANSDMSLGDTHVHYRWLICQDEDTIGFFAGSVETWDRSPGNFRVYAAVDPRWHGRGAGRELWNHCMSVLLERHDLTALTCETRDDQLRGIRFLQDRGFTLKKSTCESELVVTGYDLSKRLSERQLLIDQKIQFLPMSELAASDPDWFTKYHNLCEDFQVDMLFPPSPRTLEEHWTDHQQRRDFDSSMTIVAERDGEWMGMTALYQSDADPGLWWTTLTGVSSSHRRLGLAVALKTSGIEAVQQREGIRIRTDNDVRNPMYKINQAFGFQLLPEAQTWVRQLEGEADIREVLK